MRVEQGSRLSSGNCRHLLTVFLPQTVLMCFVRFTQQTIIITIKNINNLLFTMAKESAFHTANRILIYKTILKPVWTYGIELWGCANKSNIAIMQRYQSKLLRTIANAPWYVTIHTLHTDLHIPYVRTVIHDRTSKHRTTLASHPNPRMEPMLQPAHNRRLQ